MNWPGQVEDIKYVLSSSPVISYLHIVHY